MAKKIAPLLPSTDELLQQFGERLRLARLRRRLSAKQVCERAGMSPMTLRSLERGGSGVTIGAYLAVMQVLGIEQDLQLLGQADAVGRSLQDSRLPAPRAASVHSRTILEEGLKVALQPNAKGSRLAGGGKAEDELHKALGPNYAEMARLAAGGNAMDEMHKALGPNYAEVARLAAGGNAMDELHKALGPNYAEVARLAAGGNAMDEMHKAQEAASVVEKTRTDWANHGQFISSDALANLITSPKKKK